MAEKQLKSVFIVEDNDLQRSMIKDYLSKYPALEIREYATGEACIKDLIMGKVDEPDLILLDYFLDSAFGPTKDGLESLIKIKEICPDTNVVMLTAVENKKIIDMVMQHGALNYIVKGVDAYKGLNFILEKHFKVSA